MRDFAATFYSSQTWKDCRDAFIRSRSGLCELCLARGLYEPAVIAHHKIHLSPENINNPDITLNFDNLQALCRECHGRVHRPERRYRVDELGRVII